MKGKNVATVVLAIVSVIGVAVTTYMCSKEAPEAKEALKKAEEEYKKEHTPEAEKDNENFTVEMPKTEKAKVVIPKYVKTIIAGVITIVTILGGHIVHVTITASAVAGAYAWQKKYINLDDIVRKKAEDIGLGDFHKEVKTELAKEELRREKDARIQNEALRELNRKSFIVYDLRSRQRICITHDKLNYAMYQADERFRIDGSVSTNEWLKFLGGKPIDGGDEEGWTASNTDQVAEMSFDREGHPLTVPHIGAYIDMGDMEDGNGKTMYIYYTSAPRRFDEANESDYMFG